MANHAVPGTAVLKEAGAGSRQVWGEVGADEAPSWYLDPLVAAQKREVNFSLLRRWTSGLRPNAILKTDLFEEAHGEDQVLFALPDSSQILGADISQETASKARARCSSGGCRFLVADVRQMPLRSGVVDVVFSNSTLDHFETEEEFDRSLAEVIRVLRPGGVLVITLDNSRNPLYWLLKLLTKTRWCPFPLGYTASPPELLRKLNDGGLEVTDTDLLIHNPRVISTVVFLALRKLMGRGADGAVQWLIRLFDLMGKLPTRTFTASFVAARARKP